MDYSYKSNIRNIIENTDLEEDPPPIISEQEIYCLTEVIKDILKIFLNIEEDPYSLLTPEEILDWKKLKKRMIKRYN
ncbi:MAG: hypothetical protein J7J93_01070 [Candidatus Aenigmarchaeota archaeon]|nr:hypothetical protein [Candidatus Aenigmarchaeota archaeon]